MFTSRAEYRLSLRADNADLRLTGRGVALGCVSDRRRVVCEDKAADIEVARRTVRTLCMTPSAARRAGLTVNLDGVGRSAHDLLAYPGVDVARLTAIWPELGALAAPVAEQIEIEARYAAYLGRQEADIRAFRRDETLALPEALDYRAVGSLSNEAREKLAVTRPATLGAASRIPGVTPAALTALLRYVQRGASRRSA